MRPIPGLSAHLRDRRVRPHRTSYLSGEGVKLPTHSAVAADEAGALALRLGIASQPTEPAAQPATGAATGPEALHGRPRTESLAADHPAATGAERAAATTTHKKPAAAVLLTAAARKADIGSGGSPVEIKGGAKLSIDFKNQPSGTRTWLDHFGVFDRAELNKGATAGRAPD
jgi:hypothetical protein